MASISRFGRAISSGTSVSDNSFASRASVSSAVWSSRLAKSDGAGPVVIENSSRSVGGGTIVDGTGFVKSGARPGGALKGLEKPGNIRDISLGIAAFNQKIQNLRVVRNLL